MNFRKLFLFLSMSILWMASCTIAPDSGQFSVESDAINGKITVESGPGIKDYWNVLDDYELYEKESMYSFSHDVTEGEGSDQSIYVKFADFGEAWISGTIRYALPANDSIMRILHERYGNQIQLEKELIRQAIERSVYLSGPMMTSQESNVTKRAMLSDLIQDQAQNGTYKVEFQDTLLYDPITKKEKPVKLASPIKCTTCAGGYERSEPSPLNQYGITLYNLTIKRIKYSDIVEEQIAQQQKMNMEMDQLNIEAKRAQTNAITIAEEAKAEVAKVNAERDKLIAKAESEMKVAQLNAEKEKWNRLAEEEKAKALDAVYKVGLSPKEKAQIDKETLIGMAAEIAKAPVPLMVNNGSSQGGSSMENAFGAERALMLMQMLNQHAADLKKLQKNPPQP